MVFYFVNFPFAYICPWTGFAYMHFSYVIFMLWHTLRPGSCYREGALVLFELLRQESAVKNLHSAGLHLTQWRTPSIMPKLQYSKMFLIFLTDKFPETHFLVFLTFFRCVDLFLLTTVKFRMNFCHALRLEGCFVFFFQSARGNFRSFPSMSVSVGSRNYACLPLFLTLIDCSWPLDLSAL